MSEENKPIKFDMTINLGHFLVFLGMVGSVISLYATFIAQQERTNLRLDTMEKVISDQSAYNKAILDVLNKLQIGQAVTTDRLERLERPLRQFPNNPQPNKGSL